MFQHRELSQKDVFIVSGRRDQWPDHSQVETQILVHQPQMSPPSVHVAMVLVEALGFSLLVYCNRASSFLYHYLSIIKLTVLPLLKSHQWLQAACPLGPYLASNVTFIIYQTLL